MNSAQLLTDSSRKLNNKSICGKVNNLPEMTSLPNVGTDTILKKNFVYGKIEKTNKPQLIIADKNKHKRAISQK